MKARLSLTLVRGSQRLALGTYDPPFENAVREALERCRNALRRLELDGWVIESDRGDWIPLAKLLPKHAPRKSSVLAFDCKPRPRGSANKNGAPLASRED
jgi:hypothetical protein